MSDSPLKFRGYAGTSDIFVHYCNPCSPIVIFPVKSAETWDEFEIMDFKPKEFGDFDVEIKISHCGVCGTDVTTAQSGI
jgi:hypothetical protein